jgi:hypothetical protein
MMYENNSFHILKIAKLGLSTILEANKQNCIDGKLNENI